MTIKLIAKILVGVLIGLILVIALIQTFINFYTLIRYKRLDLVQGEDEKPLKLRLGKDTKEILKHLLGHFVLTALIALLFYANWRA